MHPFRQPFTPEDANTYVHWLYGQMATKHGLCLIAEKNGEPVGFTLGWVEEDAGDDAILFVLSPHTRSNPLLRLGLTQ